MIKNFYVNTMEVIALSKLQKRFPNSDFYSGCKIFNSVFGNYNVIFNNVLIDNSTIGDHTYIQKNTTIFNAKIGKFCSIASRVSIGPGIHKIDGISTHPALYLKNTPLIKKFSNKDLYQSSKITTIGNDVWIGEGAILLDGIQIGTGAVIGAGAVVTKDVESYAIVGGVPAKHIKYRFEKNDRDLLLKSKWWDKSEEWLMSNYSSFINPIEFLKIIEENDN